MTDALPDGINPRSVTAIEARWLPIPGHEGRLAVLERELEGRGHSWQVIAGVREWLRRKAAGRPDPATQPTRARYRHLLAELVDVDPDDDGGRPAELEPSAPAGDGGAVVEIRGAGDVEQLGERLRLAGLDAHVLERRAADRNVGVSLMGGCALPEAA